MATFPQPKITCIRFVCAALSAGLGGAAGLAQAQEAPGASPESLSLEEIVVTATRREERLQDVPISVSVVSGEQLADSAFKDLTDIQYTLPGVYFGVSPNDAGFRLRGVGTAGGYSSSSEQNVGTVVDGVVIPFGNPVSSLGDVDRVEALKGPQGTQFGKNASSGVISITTTRPDLENYSGNAYASYGSLNERDIHGSVNIPLGGTVAAQIFAFDRAYDGFVDNVVLNQEWGGSRSDGVRGKLLWKPSSDFSAYVIADYSDTRTTGPGQLWTLKALSPIYDPYFGAPFVNLAALGVTPGLDNDKSIDNYTGNQETTNYGVSLQMDLNLGAYTLTSVSAYRALDSFPTTFSIDASPLTRFEAQAQSGQSTFVSQELRITSPVTGPFSYVGGFYFSHQIAGGLPESAQLHPDPTNPALVVSITNGIGQAQTGTTSAAAFVDGSFKITDELRLIAGGRVTHDHVEASTFSVVDPSLPPFDPPPPFGSGPSGTTPYAPNPFKAAETAKTDFSGRIGPELKTGDSLFYATYARGYLGPTVTFSQLTSTQSLVKPQTVDDVTIGAKTQFLDHRLTINGDLFYDKYKDLQTAVFDGLEFITQNAGGMTAKGFEIETSYRLARHVGVNAGYSYSHDFFTNYLTTCPASIEVQGPAVTAARCSNAGGTFQAAGSQLPGAPESTVTAGATYDYNLSDAFAFDAAASYYFRDSVYGAAGDTTTIEPSYGIFNLNFGIGAPSRAWRLGFFARNLFDKQFGSAVIAVPFANPGTTVNWATREGRRTLGVSIEGRF